MCTYTKLTVIGNTNYYKVSDQVWYKSFIDLFIVYLNSDL